MTIDYKAAQALYVKHKRALTRAKNTSPDAVLVAVDKFFAEFDAAGFPLPDRWADWERARYDAQGAAIRASLARQNDRYRKATER